jgi:membrane protease YdiL (CAAX protease family)
MAEHTGERLRQGAAVLVPLAMPLAMKAVFRATTRRFGPQRGYQAGFGVYWATCWGVAAALVGPRRLAALWQAGDTALPDPRSLAAAVLVLPPLGAITTQWMPYARDAGPVAIASAAGVGVTNAFAEEALWRGVPVALFPDAPVRGWLWPALGFTAWHLVPLTAEPSSAGRRASILTGAAAIGLGYGWIAHRTRSLRLVSPVHAMTDASGVRQVRSMWLVRGPLVHT